MVDSDYNVSSFETTDVELLKHGGKEELSLPCTAEETRKRRRKGKDGKISQECELLPQPFCNDLSSLTAAQNPSLPHSIIGLVIFFISKLVGLPFPKEEAASCIKVKLGEMELQTGTVAHDPEAGAAENEDGEASKALEDSNLNPEVNATFQIPCYNSDPDGADTVSIELVNGKKSLCKIEISADMYMIIRDELSHSTDNVGGSFVYYSIVALGLEVAKNEAPKDQAGDGLV